ncbi:heme exporter protein CcmB [Hyphobacterium sp. CCMP332]|jgi:heme exporter protein B|uniref:heme exporter protein CcmB n=1 Tax=Hyphobacterium sp. CCMP332 TaxID=2749086 RepID=UPI00164FEE4D|nr:heme exporter protein CcmB [Hyphobacterium sp. CCMP332]QNL19791.1 heme exporter protein CcmB [Hyphobacterium sp. CCMP332]
MRAATVFLREARLAFAGGGGPAAPAAFFIASLTLAPLAIGQSPATLQAAGPGVICFAALLAVLQGAEKLFGEDVADGTLEAYGLSGIPMSIIAIAKVLGSAVATLWPLPLVGLGGGIAFGLPVEAAGMLGLALAAAIPGLAFLVAIAAALSAGARRGGLVIALIAAPLAIPLMVFTASAGRAAAIGDAAAGANLLLTCAVSLFLTALSPFAISAALKARLE